MITSTTKESKGTKAMKEYNSHQNHRDHPYHQHLLHQHHLHQVVEGTLTSDGVVLCARVSLELVWSTVAGLLAAISLMVVVEQTTFVSPRHRSTSTSALQRIAPGWCTGRNMKPSLINLTSEWTTKTYHVPSVTSPNDQC